MYEYRILEVLKVVDGDTFDTRISLGGQSRDGRSLGFGISAQDVALRIRLAHVDTPEVYGVKASPAGTEAKVFASEWLMGRKGRLKVRTFKGAEATVGIGDGAFGRWLGDIFDDEGAHLSAALIEKFPDVETFTIAA